MATRMQQRRGTSSQWSTSNPILNAGEIGYETDTNKFKIGDGTNHWADLTYFVDYDTMMVAIDNIVANAPALLDTLNEIAAAIGDDPSFFTTVATNLSNHENDTTNIHGIANTADLATKSYADNAVSTHESDTTNVHGITDTSALATKTYADDAVSTHNIDTTNVHGITDTADLATQSYVGGEISQHNLTTTNVHGIADTADLATQSYVNNALSNATVDQSALAGNGIDWNAVTEQFDVASDVARTTGGVVFENNTTTTNLFTTNLTASDTINANDLNVSGSLIVTGSQSIINSTNLSIKDNMIYLNEAISKSITNAVGNGTTVTYSIDNADGSFAQGNSVKVTGITPSGLNQETWTSIQSVTTTSFTINKVDTDVYVSGGTAEAKADINPDLGVIGAYNDGTYAHAGIIRDASDGGKWKFFEGVTGEPGSTLDFTSAVRSDIQVGHISATSAQIAGVTNDEIQYLDGVTSNIQTQLNAKSPSADPTFTGTVSLPSTTSIGNVSSTEIGYLDGVTSSVQTQINAKAPSVDPTFTGTVVLPSTTSIGDVSSVELGYLDGVTSAIQTQIDSKSPTANPTFTGNVTLPNTTSIGTVSKDEISYLDGVTSAIQTQIDSKASSTTVSDHVNSTTSVHGIADTSALATKTYADSSASSAVSAHESDTTNVHGIADTSALATKTYADSAVSTHNSNTTTAHGVTGAVVGTTNTQTLTNKTLTSPVINSPTGITKSDVGLSNVDNTSDANKPISTATQSALDLKAPLAGPTFTGTVVLPSTTSIGNVSATEIGYVDGVTSSIQTQLDAKAPLASPTFTGTATTANLTVTGDLTVSGTTTTVSSSSLNVTDPMIYMGGGNSANLVDLGIVSSFNDGTYQHSGIVRDASDGKWKIFKGVTDEPTTTVNFTQGSLDTLAVGAFEATSATIGNVSNTELQYLDGVTSAIQTQINAKAPSASPTFTGTVTLPSDTSIGNVSATEIGYVDGVTSSIQTQLNAKAPTASPTFTGTVTVASAGIAFTDGTQTGEGVISRTPIIQKTGAYTLSSLTERDSLIEVNSGSGVTITIPLNSAVAYPVGTSIDILQTGTGQVTIAGTGGVTVNATPGLKLRAQWSSATLFKRATDTWVVMGDLSA